MRGRKTSAFVLIAVMLVTGGCFSTRGRNSEALEGGENEAASSEEVNVGPHERLIITHFNRLGELVVDQRLESPKLKDQLQLHGSHDRLVVITQRMIQRPWYNHGSMLPSAVLSLHRDGSQLHKWDEGNTVFAGGPQDRVPPWAVEQEFIAPRFANGTYELRADPGPTDDFTVQTLYGVNGTFSRPSDWFKTDGTACQYIIVSLSGPAATFPETIPPGFRPTTFAARQSYNVEAVSCSSSGGSTRPVQLLIGSVSVDPPRQLAQDVSTTDIVRSRYVFETVTNDENLTTALIAHGFPVRRGEVLISAGAPPAHTFTATSNGALVYALEAGVTGALLCTSFPWHIHYLREIRDMRAGVMASDSVDKRCQGVSVDGVLQAGMGSVVRRWGYPVGSVTGVAAMNVQKLEWSTWTEAFIPPSPARARP